MGKILQRREWQPTPVFLFGESYGQRSLEGYSPWGLEELDTADQLSTHAGRTKFGLGLMSPLVCLWLCANHLFLNFFLHVHTALFFYFWLPWVFIAVQAFLELWQARATWPQRGMPGALRLLAAVVSLVVEHRL